MLTTVNEDKNNTVTISKESWVSFTVTFAFYTSSSHESTDSHPIHLLSYATKNIRLMEVPITLLLRQIAYLKIIEKRTINLTRENSGKHIYFFKEKN